MINYVGAVITIVDLKLCMNHRLDIQIKLVATTTSLQTATFLR
jgi:hypothetical protein